jgi:hypothetical protein
MGFIVLCFVVYSLCDRGRKTKEEGATKAAQASEEGTSRTAVDDVVMVVLNRQSRTIHLSNTSMEDSCGVV